MSEERPMKYIHYKVPTSRTKRESFMAAHPVAIRIDVLKYIRIVMILFSTNLKPFEIPEII